MVVFYEDLRRHIMCNLDYLRIWTSMKLRIILVETLKAEAIKTPVIRFQLIRIELGQM